MKKPEAQKSCDIVPLSLASATHFSTPVKNPSHYLNQIPEFTIA
jgi:hypothetical protein